MVWSTSEDASSLASETAPAIQTKRKKENTRRYTAALDRPH